MGGHPLPHGLPGTAGGSKSSSNNNQRMLPRVPAVSLWLRARPHLRCSQQCDRPLVLGLVLVTLWLYIGRDSFVGLPPGTCSAAHRGEGVLPSQLETLPQLPSPYSNPTAEQDLFSKLLLSVLGSALDGESWVSWEPG